MEDHSEVNDIVFLDVRWTQSAPRKTGLSLASGFNELITIPNIPQGTFNNVALIIEMKLVDSNVANLFW